MKISDQLLIMGALYLFLITLITYQYITDPANFSYVQNLTYVYYQIRNLRHYNITIMGYTIEYGYDRGAI